MLGMHLLVIGSILSILGIVHFLTNAKKAKVKSTAGGNAKQKEIAA